MSWQMLSIYIINEEVDRSILLMREIKLIVRARETNPKMVRVDVSKLLEQAVHTTRSNYPRKVITFTLRIAGQNNHIQAESMLVYCFENILRYLVERQELPSMKIEILVRPYDSDTMQQRIEIIDEGPTLSDEEKSLLFQWQTRIPTGGVGLPLARTLVERYNGEFRIEDNQQSQTGTGLKFVIDFPKVNRP